MNQKERGYYDHHVKTFKKRYTPVKVWRNILYSAIRYSLPQVVNAQVTKIDQNEG